MRRKTQLKKQTKRIDVIDGKKVNDDCDRI